MLTNALDQWVRAIDCEDSLLAEPLGGSYFARDSSEIHYYPQGVADRVQFFARQLANPRAEPLRVNRRCLLGQHLRLDPRDGDHWTKRRFPCR